jgi:hypothetical protein
MKALGILGRMCHAWFHLDGNFSVEATGAVLPRESMPLRACVQEKPVSAILFNGSSGPNFQEGISIETDPKLPEKIRTPFQPHRGGLRRQHDAGFGGARGFRQWQF